MNRAERRLRKRNRHRRIRRFILTAAIIVLVTGFGISWADAKDSADMGAPGPSMRSQDTAPQNTTATQDTAASHNTAASKYIPQISFTKTPTDSIINTHYLELINSDHPINDWPEAGRLTPVWPDAPVGVSRDTILHEAALSAVCGLFEEAREPKIGTYYIGSGFRDYDEQKHLYDDSPDKSYVQPPGHSEHHSGLAADIYALNVNTYEMPASREGKWLAENAWRYGLILRYADDKQGHTRIAYEPWHFRYIGEPHARFCRENNMCLEEYILFLKNSGGYETEYNGRDYIVLYERPENGLISIPEGMEYIVSGDNNGGYIVTAWKTTTY